MLIEDVFIIERMEILNEGTEKNCNMKIRGVFQRADEENNNKRIYPKALLNREVEKLAESLNGRRLMGELDHPQHDSVKLSNVSHLITKLDVKGNDIIGEAEILNTPMGQVAKALIEGGVQIGISSRGMGTLSEGQDGKRYVNEDFRLITWDLVADPSTRGAYPTLAEGRQSILVEEILNEVLPRVTKQKVFTALLTERLNESRKRFSPRERGNDWSDPNDEWSSGDANTRSKGGPNEKPAPDNPFWDDVPTKYGGKGGKKKVSKKKVSKKKASRNDSSTEIFPGLRARLSEAKKVTKKKVSKKKVSKNKANTNSAITKAEIETPAGSDYERRKAGFMKPPGQTS
jgi:hypothetical protein